MTSPKYYIFLAYTLLAFFLSFCFFDFVFDDSYDAFSSNISNAQFSDFSLLDQHYLGLIGLKDLIKFFTNIFPFINFFAVLFILSNAFSLFYTFVTLQKILTERYSKVFIQLSYFIVTLLFLENIISITHTRFATVISGLAIINLLFFQLNKKSFVAHNLLFLYGFLARPESGIGMLLIVSIGYFIFHFNFFKVLKFTIFPAVAILLFTLIFFIHKSHTDRFEIKMEPDIEYAFSTGRIVPISEMNNARDSLKYMMASSGMFIDTSFTNISFLNKLVSNQFEFKFSKLIESLRDVAYFYWYYIFFTAFILVCIILLLRRDPVLLCKLLLFQLFTFVLLVYLDFNVKIADRHFYSILLITTIICGFYLFKNVSMEHSFKKKTQIIFIVLLITGSLGFTLKNALGNQLQVANEVKCLEETMKNIEKVYQGRAIVATLSTFHLFDKKFRFINHNYDKNTYIMYDISNYSIVPRYMTYLSRKCNCNAYKPEKIFKWASENKVIFLTAKERYTLMEKYMVFKHDININFVDAEKSSSLLQPECMEHSIFNDYELKEIVFDQ